MKVKKDITDLDDFIKEVPRVFGERLKDIAENAIQKQKIENDSSKKTYQNHTWNLRNAPGYSVIVRGEEIFRNVPADADHGKAKAETEKLLNKVPKEGTKITVADGMFYASFVNSKGFDVLDTAVINVKKELEE